MFARNRAEDEGYGGAAYFSSECRPEFLRCLFQSNSAAEWGGAIYGSQGAEIFITECTFLGNSAQGDSGGGAVGCFEASLTSNMCTFVSNTAPNGSGVWCHGHDLEPRASFDHTIIASGMGGEGVSITGVAIAIFTCTNIHGNEGGDWIGPIADQYGVYGNISGSPCFCDAPSGDYGLHDTSICATEWGMCGDCGVIGAHPVGCSAASYVVRPDGSGDYPTIQGAVEAAVDCQAIKLVSVHGERFRGAGNRDIDFGGKPLVLHSEGEDPYACIIDCEGTELNPHRGFQFQSGECNGALLAGIGIMGGHALHGAAILCTDDAHPRLRHCTLFANSAITKGGGIYAEANGRIEGPILANCNVSGNSAVTAGGVYCTGLSRIFLYNTIIDSSRQGESVACEGDARATLVHCDVVGNAGGDWFGVPCIETQFDNGFQGNFSADPCFCPPADDYHLFNYSPCAQQTLVGALGVGCWDFQDAIIGSADARMPRRRFLSFPNPCTALGPVSFLVRGRNPQQSARIEICDAAGRVVRTLIGCAHAEEIREVSWNGRDEDGLPVPGGMYLIRLTMGSERHTTRLLVVR